VHLARLLHRLGRSSFEGRARARPPQSLTEKGVSDFSRL
jgi:hypothetical protein